MNYQEQQNLRYKHIETMQHAIGFSKNQITGTKHRVMHAFRNYYCSHKNDEIAVSLCSLGLMTEGANSSNDIQYFHVTKEGLVFLARLCGFEKIVETK